MITEQRYCANDLRTKKDDVVFMNPRRSTEEKEMEMVSKQDFYYVKIWKIKLQYKEKNYDFISE